jgi:predicted DCC family thiol-disulfide oxidoreductase YuxK
MLTSKYASHEGRFEVFYDGECPLCKREIDWLRKKDSRSLIQFTDIAAADFDPEAVGRSHSDLMARIHGRMPDGSVIEGFEVFRQLYSRIGFRRAVSLTRLPMIRSLLEASYRVFAKFRLPLTGRCTQAECNQGECRVSR